MATNSIHYNLIIPEGTDYVNLLTQYNPNFTDIDTAMWNNKLASVHIANEVKTGNSHAITRTEPAAAMFRMVATSDFVSGDTVSVDGVAVTALAPNGANLGSGSWLINSNVLCCLVGTNLTVYTVPATVENSDNLGGQPASYWTPSGMIAPFAGATAPAGWLICNGAAVSRTTYPALFAVCGTTYGDGNGSTTFNLPNLTGRVPVGASTTFGIGTSGGASSVTLRATNLPRNGLTVEAGAYSSSASQVGMVPMSSSLSPIIASAPTWQSTPIDTMPPYAAVSYIIKT